MAGAYFFAASADGEGGERLSVDHDRLFKELIQTFFQEFIQLFLPDVYEAIDFDHLTFLSEELYTDLLAGEKHRVDLLAETKLRGEEALIIVHVEPQAYYQRTFAERMFIYSSRLYEKYRRRILPIAVFSYDRAREVPNTFGWAFSAYGGLHYWYFPITLSRYGWRDYIRHDNPVAAALLSKMGYTEEEKVQVKKEFLLMLVRMKLDPARMHLIAGFFHTYLVLGEAEEQLLKEEIRLSDRRVEEIIHDLQYYWDKNTLQRGIEEGKIEGKIEGKLEEARRFIGMFIQTRYGEAGTKLLEQIAAINELDRLEMLGEAIFRTERLEEATKLLEQSN